MNWPPALLLVVASGQAVSSQASAPAPAIHGVVLRADKTPAARVVVTLTSPAPSGLPRCYALAAGLEAEPAVTATTDAGGRFRFDVEPWREYGLSADAGEEASEPALRVRAGDVRTLALRAKPLPMPLRDPAKEPHRIRGTVVDVKTGKAISGARVHDGVEPLRATRTLEDGSFTLEATANLVITSEKNEATLAGQAADFTEPYIELGRGAALRARLLDAQDKPLANAQVVLGAVLGVTVHEAVPVTAAIVTQTDADGWLVSNALPYDAPVDGFVRVGGSFCWFMSRVTYKDLDLGTVRVAAADRLLGQACWPDGLPREDARVLLLPSWPADEYRHWRTVQQRPAVARECLPSRAGRFGFSGIGSGDWEVCIEGEGAFPAVAKVRAGGAGAQLRLPDPNPLKVRVVDQDGAPLKGAAVEATASVEDPKWSWDLARFGIAARCRATTDESGYAVLRGAPKGARLVVKAVYRDSASGDNSFDLANDGAELEIRVN